MFLGRRRYESQTEVICETDAKTSSYSKTKFLVYPLPQKELPLIHPFFRVHFDCKNWSTTECWFAMQRVNGGSFPIFLRCKHPINGCVCHLEWDSTWTILGIVTNDIVDRYDGKVINGVRINEEMFNFSREIPKPCLGKSWPLEAFV